jgi:hypothetical protein
MQALKVEDPPSWAEDGERVPPASQEAEQGVLGCLLQDNGRLPLVGDLLDGRSYYFHQHRVIHDAIDAIVKAGQLADPVTVSAYLDARGLSEAVGGLPYLTALADSVPSPKGVRRYAEIVAERYAERELIKACSEASRGAWDTAVPLQDRIERIAGLLARAESVRQGVGSRLPLMSLGQLRAAAERVRWCVKGVIPAASVGMLFGGSGTFKSFVALDAALHVAHGLPWLGRITKQQQVLYIAAEGGAGLWSRISAWHKNRRLKVDDDSPLRVLPMAVDLTQDAWRVVETAQALGVTPGLVVVDTLSQTYSGEENSANEMAAYLRELGLRFASLWGAAVLLVHHTGHAATERPRGSSAIRANLDYLLGCHRDEREMLATVSCAKQKDGELFSDASFGMQVVELGVDEDGDKITSLVARHLSSAEEVERVRLQEKAAGRGGRNSAFVDLAVDCNAQPERVLRKAFYELLEGVDQEARKKAYFRARQWAIDNGYVDIAGDGTVIVLKKAGA